MAHTDLETLCGHCTKPASEKCANCRTQAYCNRDCQTKHWTEHKTVCEKLAAEKTIFRAADTLQRAYYLFREKTFDTSIRKIKRKGNLLILHDGTENGSNCIGGHFYPFPYALLPEKSDKAAVLTAWSCCDAIGLLHDFFRKLVDGLSVDVEELKVKLKPTKRKTIGMAPNGASNLQFETTHTIVRVLPRNNGTSWALDPTGAQYGMLDACLEWKLYQERYVQLITSRHPFGSNMDYLHRVAAIQGCIGFSYKVAWDAISAFDHAVSQWSKTEDLTLSKLVKLPEMAFRAQQAKLLILVGKELKDFVHKADYTKLSKKVKRFERNHPNEGREQCVSAASKMPLLPIVTFNPGPADIARLMQNQMLHDRDAPEELIERPGKIWPDKVESGECTHEDMMLRD